MIEMPDGQRWVYSESLDRGHFSDDPAVFVRHSRTCDVLRADVLSASGSAALILLSLDTAEQGGFLHRVAGHVDLWPDGALGATRAEEFFDGQ
ncbi:hypothetical protein [Streptomyces poriticola]|uniref:hypothetical protein n=1 Tax=Streptomyces poriticola TaxID=3120506 RepID=UPI0038CD9436